MSHAFTFHFSHGPDARPRVMVVLDLESTCGLCGYVELHRFYHGVALDLLTTRRLHDLLTHAPILIDASCANCAEPVGPAQAHRGAAVYAFADQSGAVRATFQCSDATGHALRWRLVPDAQLDPQALPEWAHPEGARPAPIDRLTERDVQTHLGRAFNPRRAWREAIAEAAASHTEVVRQASPGLRLIARGGEPASSSVIPSDSVSATLGPLDRAHARHLPGLASLCAPPRWLDPATLAALDAGRVQAHAVVDPDLAAEAFGAALTAARLTFARHDGDTIDDSAFVDIATPRDVAFRADIPLRLLVDVAASGGMTPGESGRYCAELIIAELMGLVL